jgi:hypothetical protein
VRGHFVCPSCVGRIRHLRPLPVSYACMQQVCVLRNLLANEQQHVCIRISDAKAWMYQRKHLGPPIAVTSVDPFVGGAVEHALAHHNPVRQVGIHLQPTQSDYTASRKKHKGWTLTPERSSHPNSTSRKMKGFQNIRLLKPRVRSTNDERQHRRARPTPMSLVQQRQPCGSFHLQSCS